MDNSYFSMKEKRGAMCRAGACLPCFTSDKSSTVAWRLRGACLFLALVLFFGFVFGIWFAERPSSLGNVDIIAHAAGGVYWQGQRYDYTNSEQAFFYNYEQGVRIFELDFAFSSDGELVGVHEWEEKYFGQGVGFDNPMSLNQYKNHLIAGVFCGLTFDRLLEIMENLQDFVVVLDTKESDIERYYGYIEQKLAQKTDLRDRFLPQLYSLEMYEVLERLGGYPSYILTLYKLSASRLFSLKNLQNYPKINIITMATYRTYLVNLRIFADKKIWVHTVNSPTLARRLQRMGANGIYTDAGNTIIA